MRKNPTSKAGSAASAQRNGGAEARDAGAERPDVSLIILNWNTREMLRECMESIASETRHSSTRIIVVDNGSRDGSQEMVRTVHPEALLVENGANLGFARANNIGIALSTGRYVCLSNTDIIVLDGAVDRLVAYMDAHPDVGAIAPLTVGRDMAPRENCRYMPTLVRTACDCLWVAKLFRDNHRLCGRTVPPRYLARVHDAENLSGCFLLVRREVIQTVGMLDERFFFFGEDMDWCRRIRTAGWRICFYPKARVIHYGGGSTAAAPISFQLEMEKADMQYWLKHHSRLEIILYTGIKIFHNLIHIVISLGSPKRFRGRLARLRWLLGDRG